ncbi:MAG: penicillin-binding protein 1C [Roseomonas sp.]|nr:penicillin-binding protein 1C [Roseomonas sp.]MCA3294844.1 penicillin-binding protein 1C [Roseomonas sp.]
MLALCLGALLLAPFALDRLFPPNLTRLHAVGAEVQDRDGRILSVLPAPGGFWRLATRPDDVAPVLLDLLIAAEDRRFYRHAGVDPLALGRAAGQWLRAGRVVSGGSTLTMQAARLLEPRPRGLRAKAIEIFRALQLEARFSKREILGIWLTLAPQGGNIEGVRAGALAWFGRPAQRLDAAEAALLIALARRPAALSPDRHAEAARAARDDVLRRRGAAMLSPEDQALALAAPLPNARLPMPALAPHLARELARQGDSPIRSSLDAGLQRASERLANEALARLPERASVALIIADLRTRETRALVGGAFGAENRAGSLDLTRATRSPGSALKPFLYAMAFEQGLVRPDTLLSDLPRRFGAYAPENFDRGFAGRITAAEALRLSLNLPAVALLDGVGPARFAASLRSAGAAPVLPRGVDASLPLALGGAGTTLRDMVGLYALLGDGGRVGALRFTPGQGAGAPVLEARAAAAVAGVLVQDFPGGGPRGVAWKTGTSWGGRDAWALGFDGRHMAGVWVGRPDGTPIPGLTGRDAALPVLARVFALLPEAPLERAPSRPDTPVAALGSDPLRLIFPPPGAVLAEGAGPVVLRVAGGRRPLTFLVDGAPIARDAARRELGWLPPGPGFYRIAIMDAEGALVAADVRVAPPGAPRAEGAVLRLTPAE